ncbi:retrovirus-related pol polyprotein from transposon TNT 1-94 [Tanacetum coccineum]|uniref:Retrovirus-related pol polyprotein from transposon TNT 1-94 n=1 Tax=Tanacetum coccineum TaxID=301880 RepID=A0ABQ5ISA9_9ASTR
MLNRPHGRMILASIEKGPLFWPTITVEGVTRLKEYTELTPAETIQADCDIKAINIILQGLLTEIYALVSQHRHEYYLRFTLLHNDMNIFKMPLEQFQVNTKFLNTLPAEWSKFVTDVKLVKDLHTTNVNQIHAYLEQHERHANEVCLIHDRNSDPLALVASHQMTQTPYQSHQHTYLNSQPQQQVSPYQSQQFGSPYHLVVPVFQKGDDPINVINHMMSFLTSVVTSRYPTTNNQLRNSSNPRQQATIYDGKVTMQPVKGRQTTYTASTTRTNTHGASGSNSGKQRTIIYYNYKGEGHMSKQCTKPRRKRDESWFKDKVLLVQAQAMTSSEQSNVVNHPETEITSDSNVIPYSQYLRESQQAAVQNSNSSAQQDALILSVIEQLQTQVTNCTKINLDNKSVNDTLTAELEIYKEQLKILKEGQSVGTKGQINFSDLHEQNAEIDRLKQTLSEQLQEKNSLMKTIARSIYANCSYVDKSKICYDHSTKQAIGFKNPFYLKKGQQSVPKLYDGNVIQNTCTIEILDFEETLMLAEESRSKMLLKQQDPMVSELSAEQSFWSQTSVPPLDPSPSSTTNKVVVPKEFPKVSMVNTSLKKLKCHLADFEKEQGLVLTALKNELKKLKRKALVDDAVTTRSIDPAMPKIDMEPITPRLLNKRTAHSAYIIHTQEEAVILRDLVEHVKANYPQGPALEFAFRYTKLIQDLLTHISKTCPSINNFGEQLVVVTPKNKDKKHSKLNANSESICVTSNDCMLSDKCVNARVTSKSVVQIALWYLDSGCSKHMTGDRSQLTNFVSKFLGTVKFGNDHVAKIMGFGDYQIGNVTISRVYYVEGLRHNLFSVRQFCDLNLEVAFRQHTCYIRNLEGVDLLTGSQGDNLYTLSLGDMMASSLVCLLLKASPTKSWLWHRCLSHLNFGAINHLARHGLVRGLHKLKFEKDHLCSACALGKSKKKTHKPKTEDTNQEKLYLLHTDLCGPMRVGISYGTSIARSLQQNGVIERRNRTLIEAARKMLIYAKASLFLWAEVVATTCYTQNRSMIRLRHRKTPYELLHNKPLDLSFLHVFGALCYPTNDSKNLGKLQPKADIGIFIGYAPSKKTF